MKSLFNAESGCNFDLDAELDLSGEWSIGVVVGPSGSGKTSIGWQIFGEPAPFWTPEWQADGPIIDAIAPAGDFNAVTSAGRKTTTLFDTSHPQLCQALRPDKRWRQLSGNMVGNNKTRSGNSIRRSQAKRGAEQIGGGGGYGGHFRAVQGFRYYGKVGLDA